MSLYLHPGINCVRYKDGRQVNIKDYADMALRTASKRAYLQGEGVKREEWGIHTVIMNKRGNACPLCLAWVGKVMVDDVWSGGTAKEAEKSEYPLMSEARASSWKEKANEFIHDQSGYVTLGKSEDNFIDVTEEWLEKATPSTYPVSELQEYTSNGVTYRIDGINAKQKNSDRELQVANLLKNILGLNVNLVPEINGKYGRVSTLDYLIDGKRWDLKELVNGESSELLRNIVHKKKKQAENFVFDISSCKLSDEEVNRQKEYLAHISTLNTQRQ